ncbi:cell cycle transcriptional repressor whi5 [Diplogelasinospora grovesii]|uniref:Cell cycle transcriptional repressor whi5 n=1 Tax=Diplogelasinospora grovesii TaxID=303347 RepID=A0AAN6MYN8_9PEZI|nr:cell cycle transcriptional repressor whi5 [Diplogelasinospora grovesii]
MDLGTPSVPPRLDPRRVADKVTETIPHPAPNRGNSFGHGKMQQDGDVTSARSSQRPRLSGREDVTLSRVNRADSALPGRDQATAEAADDPRAADYSPPFPGSQAITIDSRHTRSFPAPPLLPASSSNSNSQDTLNEADRVFTPPGSGSEGGMSSTGNAAGQNSSQESQLQQLSELAAAREKMPDHNDMLMSAEGDFSRKRMADGMVKHTRARSSASPVRMSGHSRTTSAVSVASTASSRIGEVSAGLKAKLQYAMVKVERGWQAHTIDQVETLASQAASPASSTSTVHLRNGFSASPQLSTASNRASNNTTPATGPQHQFPGRLTDRVWPELPYSGSRGSPTSPVKATPTLAPPVSIQPARHYAYPRRNSDPRRSPAFPTNSQHASPNAGPNTPGQPSRYLGTPHQGTRMVDPILFSPDQNNHNNREQDAIETLLYMSSPRDPANVRHSIPASSSQPIMYSHSGSQRTALPTSQPRKSLPSGRPTHHGHSQSLSHKRVGFEKSPSGMDIDESFGSPHFRGTPRRRVNGGYGHARTDSHMSTPPRLKQMPVSLGLTVPPRQRPALGDEDIDRMIDRARTEDSSDSEGEIHIPVGRTRREGAHVFGA